MIVVGRRNVWSSKSKLQFEIKYLSTIFVTCNSMSNRLGNVRLKGRSSFIEHSTICSGDPNAEL
jgi:hypothetical protein